MLLSVHCSSAGPNSFPLGARHPAHQHPAEPAPILLSFKVTYIHFRAQAGKQSTAEGSLQQSNSPTVDTVSSPNRKPRSSSPRHRTMEQTTQGTGRCSSEQGGMRHTSLIYQPIFPPALCCDKDQHHFSGSDGPKAAHKPEGLAMQRDTDPLKGWAGTGGTGQGEWL